MTLTVGMGALGGEGAPWETVLTGPPVTIKNRAVEGTSLHEVWAEGDVFYRR